MSHGPAPASAPAPTQSVTLILCWGQGPTMVPRGTWFTQCKAANFVATGKRGDPLLLLLLGAKLQDRPQVEGLWRWEKG